MVPTRRRKSSILTCVILISEYLRFGQLFQQEKGFSFDMFWLWCMPKVLYHHYVAILVGSSCFHLCACTRSRRFQTCFMCTLALAYDSLRLLWWFSTRFKPQSSPYVYTVYQWYMLQRFHRHCSVYEEFQIAAFTAHIIYPKRST